MRESTYFFKKNLYYLIGQLLFSLRPTPMMAPTDSFGGDLEPVAVQQLTRMDAVFLSMEASFRRRGGGDVVGAYRHDAAHAC